MKPYELTCEISTNLSEDELKETIEKIGSFIIEENGTVEKITEPIKRKLAYTIKKAKEAFLTNFIFKIEPDKLSNLGKKLKSETNIIRYMVLTKMNEKMAPRKIRIPKGKTFLPDEQEKEAVEISNKKSGAIEEAVKKERAKHAKPKKVDLKEIDQKIEEILSE